MTDVNFSPTNMPGVTSGKLIANGQGASSTATGGDNGGNLNSAQVDFYTNAAGKPVNTGRPSIGQEAAQFKAQLASGQNVGASVAADFSAWCQARGLPANATSFSSFSAAYSSSLKQAGLSQTDINSALTQGETALFNSGKIKDFTMGQVSA